MLAAASARWYRNLWTLGGARPAPSSFPAQQHSPWLVSPWRRRGRRQRLPAAAVRGHQNTSGAQERRRGHGHLHRISRCLAARVAKIEGRRPSRGTRSPIARCAKDHNHGRARISTLSAFRAAVTGRRSPQQFSEVRALATTSPTPPGHHHHFAHRSTLARPSPSTSGDRLRSRSQQRSTSKTS